MNGNSSAGDTQVTAISRYIKSGQCSGTYNLNMMSYAGYINVSKTDDNYLYYWFFESRASAADVAEVPLVIWLNGGPGASSLAGLFLENGPFLLKDISDDEAEIVENPNGWNRSTHLLYWDQPVGTGFSYSGRDKYVKTEAELSEQFYNGLQGFFNTYPQYRNCDLYITGESYGGKYIPNIGLTIKHKNEVSPAEAQINLKGLGIGDGWMYPELQTQLQIAYGYEMGFVDTRQRATIEQLYAAYKAAMDRKEPVAAFNLGNNVSNTILNCGGNPDIYDVRRWSDLSIANLQQYLDCEAVKSSIHARGKWQFADADSKVADNLIVDLERDVTALFPELINSYRMLFYTGNFDMSCGYAGTEQILQNWNYQQNWNNVLRNVWSAAASNDPQGPLGYVKTLGNLTQCVIPDSGHQVPVSKPGASLAMIETWVFKKKFAGYIPVVVSANTIWADTEIHIFADQETTIRYLSGTWTANPDTGFVDESGNPNYIAKPGYTLPGACEGALCGRVGENGEVFLIGTEFRLPTEAAGKLYLCINDDLSGQYGSGFSDNLGALTVGVYVDV
jgi:carboxypeptidase C (cathepsin A)